MIAGLGVRKRVVDVVVSSDATDSFSSAFVSSIVAGAECARACAAVIVDITVSPMN
jgi:hypothetical protein